MAAFSSGPYTAQIQRALSALLSSTITWTGTQTFTNGITITKDTNAAFLATILQNTSTGTAAQTVLRVGNDANSAAGTLVTFGTGFTTSGTGIADSTRLLNQRAGGLSLVASNASGDVRIYSRNVLAATFGASQAAAFTGTVSAPTINATTAYQANGTPGVSFGPAAPASITVVNGIVTAIS